MPLLPIGIGFLLTDTANVRDVALLDTRCMTGRVVVGFVQTQMLGSLLARLGTLEHNGLQDEGKHLTVMDIGTGNGNG